MFNHQEFDGINPKYKRLMRRIVLLVLLAGFLGAGFPLHAQTYQAPFADEYLKNQMLLLQGDSLHPALVHAKSRSADGAFHENAYPGFIGWEPGEKGFIIRPSFDFFGEMKGSRIRGMGALGVSVEYPGKDLQFKTGIFAGLNPLNGPGFLRFDTVDIRPAYGYWQKNNYWLDATFHLCYTLTDYLHVTLGRGRQKTGTGMRSLLLGNQGSPYPFLNLALNLEHLHYDFRLMKLREYAEIKGKDRYIEKYGVMHQFSWNASDWLNLYGFEAIVWGARDSVGYRGWELNYLNPVAFLRPVEFSIGSPDNVLMGLGIGLKPWNNLLLYSQFVLDEFNLSYSKVQETWWANKYGVQAGFRWVNPLPSRESWIQAEANVVRPFTYSHADRYKSYSHGMEALAHPAGANFAELLLHAGFYLNSLKVSLKGNWLAKGMDSQMHASYGGDILKPYSWRNANFGINMLQGEYNRFLRGTIRVSREIFNNSGPEVYGSVGLEHMQAGAVKRVEYFIRLGVVWGLQHPKTNFLYSMQK